MNDNLFDIPETAPDPLVAARKRYEAAAREREIADDCLDSFGDPIPEEVEAELKAAREHLARAEAAELERRRG